MKNASESKNEHYLTGLFTMILEKGKPYQLYMEKEFLQMLGISPNLTPEDTYYSWLQHIRPEDRITVEHAIRSNQNGLQAEIKYVWNHDTLGSLDLCSSGILTEKTDTHITIKGYFKTVNQYSSSPSYEDKNIRLFKSLLTDVFIEIFEVCALLDIKTNSIMFIRNMMFPELSGVNATYDICRDYVLGLTFKDDADRLRVMSARNKISEYFERFDGEYMTEVRIMNPVEKQFNNVKVRFLRFGQPLAGKYSELLTIGKITENKTETYLTMLRKRLIDGLSIPYREVDLINLRTGALYSSKSGLSMYSDSFGEQGQFDDFLGKYVDDCEVTEEQRENVIGKFRVKNMSKLFEEGTTLIETELRHKNINSGNYEWVRVQAFQSATDEERKPYMAILTVTPINEEKEKELQAKQALEISLRSERQYRKAILSTAMAMYTYNVTKDVLSEEMIEEAGVEALLPKLGIVAPCSYNEYVELKSHFITTEQEANHFRKTFNTETLLDMFSSKRYTFDFEYGFAIGKKRGVFRETVILTKDLETGEVWGLSYVRNITEERRQNKRIEQALRDAFDQAKAANNSKTLFMSQMSHDIRTPLNSILGMAAIAQEHIDDKERVKDCMDKIDYAGRHLLDIINNVLDLSAIESGKMSLNPVNFNLKKFIEEMMNIVQPLADKRGHTLVTEIGDIHESVTGDKTKLRQLLMNILSNSVKYTPNGGKIVFRAEELEPDRQDVCRYLFTVEDNGIGMPQEFIDKIFEPFSRADSQRTSNVQGTGLGMAIAKNIALMMNGNIRVASEVNKGTRFEIIVCLKRAENPNERYIGEINLAETEKVRMSDFDFGGKRVLLAEDLAFNAEIAAEFLTEAGLVVDHATDGEKAVEMFEKSPVGYYDLIFMDIQMPKLDGYAAAIKIRGMDRADAASVPIIAMTANAFMDDIQHSYDSGMNGHIAKPIEIPRLAQTLVKIFGDKRKAT